MDISIEDIERLIKTAPAWPKGRLAFRSLRIRFGHGEMGVAQTFDRHVKMIKKVFHEGLTYLDVLPTVKAPHYRDLTRRLRLSVGNQTHKPTIEWILVDIGANQEREELTDAHFMQGLADELLVFTWMFPSYLRRITLNDLEYPMLVAAGYENYVDNEPDPWVGTVLIDYSDKVILFDDLIGGSEMSIPVEITQ